MLLVVLLVLPQLLLIVVLLFVVLVIITRLNKIATKLLFDEQPSFDSLLLLVSIVEEHSNLTEQYFPPRRLSS